MKMIEALEREGGHIVVLIGLVCAGVAVAVFTPDHNDRFLDASIAALLLAMKGNGNGKGPPPPKDLPEPAPTKPNETPS